MHVGRLDAACVHRRVWRGKLVAGYYEVSLPNLLDRLGRAIGHLDLRPRRKTCPASRTHPRADIGSSTLERCVAEGTWIAIATLRSQKPIALDHVDSVFDGANRVVIRLIHVERCLRETLDGTARSADEAAPEFAL